MRTLIAVAFLLAGVAIVAHCANVAKNHTRQQNEMWITAVEHGRSSFHANPAGYQVYRNVMDFGCVGDGVVDDTACINTAISSGGRCGQGCGSSTILPALIYFPSGTYLVSSPIIMYYFSQLVGNANNPPTLVAAPNFGGMAVIDSNPYGDGGNNWYTNQNNFFRQVRNFVIDLTRTPSASATTGIHWQVAQATSLFNIRFVMSRTLGTQHQGIWMENGSGGFMSDLRFEGGKYGMWVGNQQFLSRALEFDGCDTAVYMNWNWQWTFKDLTISNCRIGIDMSALGDQVTSGVGSILLMDSTISNTPSGVLLRAFPAPHVGDTSGTLLLDNVRVDAVPNVVVDTSGQALLTSSGQQTIPSWGRGSFYQDDSGVNTFAADYLPNIVKDPSLLDAQGKFFAKSRPQYETLPADEFASVKAGGAQGDGNTDDSDAIQAVINANVNGKVVYFPAGSYVIGKTVNIPPGTRIIGETWSVLMAGGAAFQDANNPQPMFKVGEPGQTGSVEITDLFFASKGAQPGAILVQWNIAQSSQGSAAMWDSHFRVGGFQGSELQVAQCPRGQGAVPQCNGVHTLLQVAATGSGLFENVWAWTADHDLDNQLAQGQISIYTGRGVLIESTTGPVWLYGTQSEHNVFHQYQLNNARNVFMTMIQSETPYWQPGPPAPSPYTPNPTFDDPSYAHCAPGDVRCPMSYAIRARNCQNVYVYGAGMYNFFNNYDQTCLNTEDCQSSMVDLDNNSGFHMYNINTKAAVNMVTENNGRALARGADNINGFCQTVNAFLTQA
ncbi:probable glucan endo-1,3-beta-glucosidase ARB_02077 [Folsomia candida]|uniref:Glucan 1,3-beta-glucosidase n=1 Tax=Folsomia candida TaxID=158441 RepID=A0A226ERL9_FOLCA|nr:probable glucan endo-1,3-beta-glucosidase ARB_02077 [Folsomia candida]OXA60273.1 Glucan 1,3-beta-glucosidase [Folsomia candida]